MTITGELWAAVFLIAAGVSEWLDPGLHGTAAALFFLICMIHFSFVGGALAPTVDHIEKQLTEIQRELKELSAKQ